MKTPYIPSKADCRDAIKYLFSDKEDKPKMTRSRKNYVHFKIAEYSRKIDNAVRQYRMYKKLLDWFFITSVVY